MKTLEEYNKLILQWADEKGILEHGTPTAQAIKTLEEVVETLSAINSGSLDEIKDGIGDIYVTLVIQAKMWGWNAHDLSPVNTRVRSNDDVIYVLLTTASYIYDLTKSSSGTIVVGSVAKAVGLLHALAKHFHVTLEECVDVSYKVISERDGEMVDGMFIKEQ